MSIRDFKEALISWIDWDISLYPPQPLLKIIQNNTVKSISLKNGDKIYINFNFNKRYCIGILDEYDNILKCNFNHVIEKGLRCRECLDKDIYWKCAQCIGTECLNIKARNFCFTNAHTVYLAAFTPKFIKVGVSWSPRFLKRISEQGASIALRIAECNSGFIARALERIISHELQIPDKMSMKNKKMALQTNLNLNEMIDLVQVTKEKVTQLLKKSKFKKNLLINEEIYDLFTPYLEKLKFYENRMVIVWDSKENILKTIKGEFIIQRGFYMLIKTTFNVLVPSVVAIPVNKLFGFKINHGIITSQS